MMNSMQPALGSPEMTWLYILGAVVSVGLLIYLVAALLKPEDFS
jgi:K+-transporting ATPase KdpF subunit